MGKLPQKFSLNEVLAGITLTHCSFFREPGWELGFFFKPFCRDNIEKFEVGEIEIVN